MGIDYVCMHRIYACWYLLFINVCWIIYRLYICIYACIGTSTACINVYVIYFVLCAHLCTRTCMHLPAFIYRTQSYKIRIIVLFLFFNAHARFNGIKKQKTYFTSCVRTAGFQRQRAASITTRSNIDNYKKVLLCTINR